MVIHYVCRNSVFNSVIWNSQISIIDEWKYAIQQINIIIISINLLIEKHLIPKPLSASNQSIPVRWMELALSQRNSCWLGPHKSYRIRSQKFQNRANILLCVIWDSVRRMRIKACTDRLVQSYYIAVCVRWAPIRTEFGFDWHRSMYCMPQVFYANCSTDSLTAVELSIHRFLQEPNAILITHPKCYSKEQS